MLSLVFLVVTIYTRQTLYTLIPTQCSQIELTYWLIPVCLPQQIVHISHRDIPAVMFLRVRPICILKAFKIFSYFVTPKQIGQPISSMVHPIYCQLHFIFFHLQLFLIFFDIVNMINHKIAIFPSNITQYMSIFLFALSRNGSMN